MSRSAAQGLVDFVAASPSPFHCVATVTAALDAGGFTRIDERSDPARLEAGSAHYIVRGGSVVAWRTGTDAPGQAGFRILGAHTDSPNLRLKPRAATSGQGWKQLAVEPYGGVLLHTWTDRDLGLSGKVVVRGAEGPEVRLFRDDRALARVPNLAIHLNRTVNTDGLVLDRQKHLAPVVGLGEWADFEGWLAEALQVEAVLSWELGLHDVVPPCLGGVDEEFIFAPRMDNQACCYTALSALLGGGAAAATRVVGLFDHEEIGSESWSGARGPFLGDVLTRLVDHHEARSAGGLVQAKARSWMLSADMAHGVHPNYADKHEPGHRPMMNGGPVLKTHVEQRYATDAEAMARFKLACERASVPMQHFVTRSDLACGSTIGPISSAQLGIRAADIGAPMLSMHSIREQAGAADVAMMTAAMAAFLQG